MRAATAAICICFLTAFGAAQAPADDWQIVVLGIAQDGGIPQLGCERPLCLDVRAGKRKAEKVSSLGLVNRRSGDAYVFDATPDMPGQLQALTGGRLPRGVFLTHAHIGHYTGLMFFGRESVNASNVPVFATERMCAYLRANGPWSQLVSISNIRLNPIVYDQAVALDGGVRVTAFQVPHRDEFSDTVGYRIDGPRRSAIFIPDIDRWENWNRSIRALADSADYAFLDGTFASPTEINRPIAEIPHPMMSRTRELLGGARAALWFIHLNNSNAEFDAPDVAREGQTFPM
jgi:pyrroloquinoline quinone biosynthesis protein B